MTVNLSKLNYLKTAIQVSNDPSEIRHHLVALQEGLPENEKTGHLQAEAIRVQKVAQERLALLANRQVLYRQYTLPDVLPDPIFCFDVPHLENKIRRFQACLQKVLSAQEPLSHIKDFTAYYGYERDDLLSLEDVRMTTDLLASLPPNHPVQQAVQNFLDQVNNAVQNKISLLTDLAAAFDWDVPFEEWSAEDQMKILVQAEQILSNPYEPKFAMSDLIVDRPDLQKLADLIERLKNDNTASDSKDDFWDYVPELERKAHQLAKKTDLKLLQDAKKEGLLAICRKSSKKDSNPCLIVGAGPAGLIQAISFALQGKNIEILEKRNAEKEGRPNTVTFGKWNPQELKILLFLGTLSRLEGKSSFGHNRAHYTETSLGDLETALEETLHSIHPDISIQYQTTVEKIHPDGSVDLKTSHGITHRTNLSAVIAADGTHSTTRKLLGVGFKELSRPTKLAFSIYKKDPDEASAPLWKVVAYRVTNALKGVWIILKILFNCIIHRYTIFQAISRGIGEGPSGLSRLNRHDYQLTIFREKEQKILEQYQDRMTVLEYLGQDSSAIAQEMQKRLEEKSKAIHGPLDFLHMLFRPKGHTMRPIGMVLDKTYSADVMLRKAERSQMLLGNTMFTIRGDASHSTDPYSGTGAKTAIEETVADTYFFNIAPHQRTDLDRAIWEMGFESYQDKMFKGAFAERFDYYPGTEMPEWFADLALSQRFIIEEEKDLYLNVKAKLEAAIPLSQQEEAKAKALKTKCLTLAQQSKISLPLENREKKAIREAIKHPEVNNPALEPILNKLCCLGHPVGALLQIARHLP